MLKKIIAGVGMTAFVATAVLAQDVPGAAPQQGRRAGRAAGAAPAADPTTPTQAQWDTPEAQAYVTKAKALAGDDPDLQFDVAFNCTPDGTHAPGGGGGGGGDGAAAGNTGIPFVASSRPAIPLPPQHVMDNLWWFGDSGVGSWLITTPKGYILFDTLNTAAEEQSVLLDGMKTVGLDPKNIKYVIMGHWHLDHTGGGHLIQSTLHPIMMMGRDDWPLYFKAVADDVAAGANGRLTDKTPMTQGLDVEDGERITLGGTTLTFYSMPGHTPGSTGFIFNAKYQGKPHPVLIVTASAGGNNVKNRETFIGGYEHIWNAAEKANVESVMQSHPNYNQNTLSRMEYLTAHYPLAKNPMLYGAEKDRKYIEITRACAQARLAALGW